jgi:hypothetical protein
MTDDILDPRFERDLRAVLADNEPGDAPASLYAIVADVPGRPRSRRPTALSMAFAGVAMAAVVVIAMAAIAIAFRPFGDAPVGGVATPSPSAAGSLHIDYQVLPVGAVAPTHDDLLVIARIMQSRLEATGVAASSVTPAGTSTIRVDVAVDPTAEDVTSQLRSLLGATGRLDFVPLGATEMAQGDTIDLNQYPPLFSGDQVAAASIGSDQTGQRTVDLTLKDQGKQLFADFTAQHVGQYFAIVLDGQVISAPVIMDSISDGKVQISGGGVGGWPLAEAQDLVGILRFGALPFPLREVSNSTGPAGPTATDAVPTAPTQGATPAPSS